MRHDLLVADAEAGTRAAMAGSPQGSAQHSRYSAGFRPRRSEGSEHLRYLIGRVPRGRRCDHHLYGIGDAAG